MGKKDNRRSDAAEVQVFELTMDNPEDQDELNRRLHKPGEPNNGPPAKTGPTVQAESATRSTRKKKRTS
jgi:hypothetical protein